MSDECVPLCEHIRYNNYIILNYYYPIILNSFFSATGCRSQSQPSLAERTGGKPAQVTSHSITGLNSFIS